MDIAGRRVVARDVGSLGMGQHAVDISEGTRLIPGLYFVRLTQGADRCVRRVVVMH
jgi:hypothetical protein